MNIFNRLNRMDTRFLGQITKAHFLKIDLPLKFFADTKNIFKFSLIRPGVYKGRKVKSAAKVRPRHKLNIDTFKC